MGGKLRIAVVFPPLSGHAKRGVGSYTENLIAALRKNELLDVQITGYGHAYGSSQLVHYPYFDPFFLTLPLVKVKPATVTVHDLIPLEFPDKFPIGIRGLVKWQIQRLSLFGSSAIVTDSTSSKKSIQKFCGKGVKIHVIYPGVARTFHKVSSTALLKNTKQKLNLPDNFILYVGDVNYNKNVVGLIESFKKVSVHDPSINLVLAGSGFIDKSRELENIKNTIYILGLNKHVTMFGFLPNTELVHLYNLATMYVQPSFAEGFGLPVLEAMACGIPVVASRTTSIPEIAGSAALFVNPYDTDEIARAIMRLFHDKKLQERLILKGRERFRKFTWESTASNFYKLWYSILKAQHHG
ncbi:glycosyltransferase family 4 protein [Candidatus Gottesmanbacteria bacterium]|nr:glycosyltransferase family 4 protein [Candidatus Gottesmanbacteria bacterium]